MRTIKIKYLRGVQKIERFNVGDWIDLRAAEDVEMKKGEFKLIPLGVAMELPKADPKADVSKAIAGDPVKYKQYTKALSELKADKDKNGNAIAGSRKEKGIAYINGLDASYGEKIVLYKKEYPSDDRYNGDILEYINSRNDLSYQEKITICKELGFTVRSDGYVTWD